MICSYSNFEMYTFNIYKILILANGLSNYLLLVSQGEFTPQGQFP